MPVVRMNLGALLPLPRARTCAKDATTSASGLYTAAHVGHWRVRHLILVGHEAHYHFLGYPVSSLHLLSLFEFNHLT